MNGQRLALLLGLLAGAACAWPQAPDLKRMDFVLRSVPDGPVAKVHGVNISAAEFTNRYQTELVTVMMQTGKREVPDELRLETAYHALALLVHREILFQEALERHLSVGDEELEAYWRKELQAANKTFQARSDGPITEAQLLEWTGLSKEEALEDIRKELLIEKVRAALGDERGVKVTEREIKTFFEENHKLFKRPDRCHLKHIFVGLGPDQSLPEAERKALARAKIEKALSRIRAGESFEGVAKDMSEAPGRELGGDMGMLAMADLPPFYVDAAYALKAGRISDIIESEMGYHVIKLVEFAPGEEPSLAKATPTIREMLLNQKRNEAVEAFCDPVLKEEGAVLVFLQLDKTLATHPGGGQLHLKLGGKAPEDGSE